MPLPASVLDLPDHQANFFQALFDRRPVQMPKAADERAVRRRTTTQKLEDFIGLEAFGDFLGTVNANRIAIDQQTQSDSWRTEFSFAAGSGGVQGGFIQCLHGI